MFPYLTGKEADKYQFYKVPQLLFTDDKFIELSCESKLLYGILLDRCGLSKKNKWFDDDGKIYVILRQDEACEKLRIGKDKAIKTFNELEKIGLILRKKQGQGKPTKIYVCDFSSFIDDTEAQTSAIESEIEVKTSENPMSEKSDVCESNNIEVLTSENPMSAPRENRGLSSYYMNQTNISQTQSIYQCGESKPKSENDGWTDEEQDEFEADVKEQIEYDVLLTQGIEQSTLDLIVDIIVEAYNPQANPLKINGQLVSPTSVIRQYGKLNSEHIKYILNCISEVSAKKRIKDLRGYLRTSLYNAPHTMELHTSNEVNFILGSK